MQLVRLYFLAPIPVGNLVILTWFKYRSEVTATCVAADRTAGIVYCNDYVWSSLGGEAQALADPVAVLTKHGSWTLTRSLQGISGGALVSTRDDGDGNHIRTDLFLKDAPATPYR